MCKPLTRLLLGVPQHGRGDQGRGAGSSWQCTAGQPQSEDAQSLYPPSSGATPQPLGLKAPQAAVPTSRGPACLWSGELPFSPPQPEAPDPQIPLKRTVGVGVPLSQGLECPGQPPSPQPRHPGERGLLLPPSPRWCWRQLWGAPGKKNAEGCPHQMQAVWHSMGTGTGTRPAHKAPSDIFLFPSGGQSRPSRSRS